MIITCQNCQTHYSVDLRLIGGGKAVRCENCGNSWHQHPQQAAPPPMVAQPVAAPPMAAQPVYAAVAPAPVETAVSEAPPPQPIEPVAEPAPAPEPAPEPETLPAADVPSEAPPDTDAEAAAMEEDTGTEEAAMETDAGAAGETDDALSPDQLDEMFGDEPDSEVFESISGGGSDDEITDLSELENLPDPEPIPQGFSSPDDDLIDDGLEKKGKGKGMIIGVGVLVLILALGAGAFFGRSQIIGLWPGAADIYHMLSLGGEELGAGLVIQDVKSTRQVEDGVDVLIIKGSIANVSEEDHKVPMIRVALFDANGDEVQFAAAAPLKNSLQPGTKIGFSAKLTEPSALGRRVVVTFMEAEKKGH